MKLAILVALSAAAIAVAETSQLPAGVPPCVMACAEEGIKATDCKDVTDYACMCNSSAFVTASTTCLYSKCPSEMSASLALHQTMCFGSGSTDSGAGAAAAGDASASPGDAGASGAVAPPPSGTRSLELMPALSGTATGYPASPDAADPTAQPAGASGASGAAPVAVKPSGGSASASAPAGSSSAPAPSAGAASSVAPLGGASVAVAAIGAAVFGAALLF